MENMLGSMCSANSRRGLEKWGEVACSIRGTVALAILGQHIISVVRGAGLKVLSSEKLRRVKKLYQSTGSSPMLQCWALFCTVVEPTSCI